MVERMRDLNSKFRMHTSSYGRIILCHTAQIWLVALPLEFPRAYTQSDFASRESKQPIQSIHHSAFLIYARPLSY
jgi:hypothetical protein